MLLSSYGDWWLIAAPRTSPLYPHSICSVGDRVGVVWLWAGPMEPIWLTSVCPRDPFLTNQPTTRSSMFLGLCHVLESVTLLVGDSDCSVLLKEARSI
jgi:hypothetical protein